MKNKKNKIINDTIYGFIKLENSIILKIINHRYFQRLRYISQLGLSYLVFPGAHHTRFHHAIGCLHLINNAIIQLRNKGNLITYEEEEAVKIAILLHDIGHGPFSHALENSIINNIPHEDISYMFMHRLNEEFSGKLSLAIKIFKNKYKKKFLHQLICSQLDIDRLDYLRRDSFYTGVAEGNIGTERIINMFDIVNDKIVIEEKGIYSIEKFIIARRLMYWQVYLHKTVIASEKILENILKRAKELIKKNKKIYSPTSLLTFLNKKHSIKNFKNKPHLLDMFSDLNDADIFVCLKYWKESDDFILSQLSKMILNRKLLKIKIQKVKFNNDKILKISNILMKKYKLNCDEVKYFIFSDKVINHTYNPINDNINILMKNGNICDITKISSLLKLSNLKKEISKYYLCYPNIINL